MAKGGLVNLVIAKYQQQPYPKAALPVLTLTGWIHFNDNQIDLMHFSPARTNGDTAKFRNQNAVHLGDVFNNSGYPFVDVDSGDIDGMINFCEQTLAAVGPMASSSPGTGL